jgi:hypothetical protein
LAYDPEPLGAVAGQKEKRKPCQASASLY